MTDTNTNNGITAGPKVPVGVTETYDAKFQRLICCYQNVDGEIEKNRQIYREGLQCKKQWQKEVKKRKNAVIKELDICLADGLSDDTLQRLEQQIAAYRLVEKPYSTLTKPVQVETTGIQPQDGSSSSGDEDFER